MLITLRGSEPLYQQIYASLRRAILEGRLAAGERLPATRALAEQLGVSRTVVLDAYRQLSAEGYVSARVGSGTYVTDMPPEAMMSVKSDPDDRGKADSIQPRLTEAAKRLAADPPLGVPWSGRTSPHRAYEYDFEVGRLAQEDFPYDVWRRLLARHVRRVRPHYGDPAGYPPLREAIARHIRRYRAVTCDPEQVVIVAGARQAFDVAARVLLEPGATAVLEEPHFSDARYPMRAAGARLLGVPVDADGLRTDRLPCGGDARLACVTPSHQFPTGAILSLRRRTALLEWANRVGAYIIEDDYDSEFQYDVRPVEALQALDATGRVIYVGTCSKTLSPDIRIGYAVLPKPLFEPFLRMKWITHRQSPLLIQLALTDFMESGEYGRHVRRCRKRYAERRSILISSIERELGAGVEVLGHKAGVHVLIRFRELSAPHVGPLIEAAARAGVRVAGVEGHYLDPPDQAELLLGYAAIGGDRIREGIRRLADSVKRIRSRRSGAV